MTPTRMFRRRKTNRLRGGSAGRAQTASALGERVGAATTYPFTVASELRHVAGDRRHPLTFGSQDADAIEAELYSHLTPVKRRIWLQRALLLAVRAMLLAAGLFCAVAFLRFAAVPLPPPTAEVLSAIVGVWALLLILRQRVTYADSARVLDRRLDLEQTIGTAVELIHSGADGRLARLQLRRATDSVRRVESGRVVPLRLPLRDVRTLGGLVVLTLLFTYLATLNLSWPGQTPPIEEMTIDPGLEMTEEVPYAPSVFEGDTGGFLDPSLFDSSLDTYLSDLEGQNLSPEELAARVAEIQQQLAQRAEAASRQREALGELADALADSSSTSDASENIRRGEYAKASSQLSELGKQSAQLSPRARQDLARRLNDAAQRVAPNNPDLANRMRRAAQALSQNDAAQTEQAMNELAEGINQAGEQLQSLNDTSASYDPSMMGEMPQDFDPSTMSGLQSEGLEGLGEYEGAPAPGEDGGEGFGEGFGDLEGTGMGDPALSPGDQGSGGAQRSDQLGSEAAGGSGGAGAGQGREQYAPPNATQQQGKLLELRGRPSDGGGGTLEEGSKVPLVGSNDGSVTGSGASGGRTVIVDPLSIRGEQNFVPWEKRQIIKDYFSGAPVGSSATTGPTATGGR
jgi:hypothetical protein